MNDGDGQAWSAMTECPGERLLSSATTTATFRRCVELVSRIASRHMREGVPASRPEVGDRAVSQLGCQLGCQTAFRPTVGSRFCL